MEVQEARICTRLGFGWLGHLLAWTPIITKGSSRRFYWLLQTIGMLWWRVATAGGQPPSTVRIRRKMVHRFSWRSFDSSISCQKSLAAWTQPEVMLLFSEESVAAAALDSVHEVGHFNGVSVVDLPIMVRTWTPTTHLWTTLSASLLIFMSRFGMLVVLKMRSMILNQNHH